MVGNRLHKGYNSIRAKDYTLTECFEDYPDLRENLNKLWENLTFLDTFFSKRDPTKEECEEAAKVAEDWCRMFPKMFPQRNLTRKMAEYSLVLPRFIREKGSLMNKILRLEQEGERLHAVLNGLESSLRNIQKKEQRYFIMLKRYENKLYATK